MLGNTHRMCRHSGSILTRCCCCILEELGQEATKKIAAEAKGAQCEAHSHVPCKKAQRAS